MSFQRRRFFQAALAGSLLSGALPTFGRAQGAAWPGGPVRFVVPFAPGGGADMATRLMAEKLRSAWGGVPALVDNRPGANTIIAADAVLGAPRDGSTFLATISLTTQLPFLMQKVNFNPETDLVPVAAITTEQLVLVTNAALGIKRFKDLVEAARRQPGKFAFGSYGVGSNSHLVLIEINKASDAELVHVPYKGAAPAVQAVLSGEVALALSNLGTVKQHIASGRLVPLAVTGERRSRFVPEVPTLLELGIKGFETPAWIGVFAARGTPAAIVNKLGADVQAAVAAPDLVARLQDFGQEPGQMSTAEFQALVKRDSDNAGQMIRAAGVRLE
ncbi:tripartite tricarboxylate transporter substrate binding protein [uncultured Pseudacidovorax sp.]|uniref:Bug family tripartite tricarboxylate transporter substrate binding protein n=1 Tax=uncultured Pseudacidovorax sp. TaxID=679313 RepID=UPI0025D0A3DA|nr:tripartite tricarboxylate transporter substrate binding protein [uncultured Pseudacidovorax sp.]